MAISIIPHFQVHDDVIKWKHFPRYLPFVRRILLTKASDAELWYAFHLCLNKLWLDNGEAGDLRRHRAHYDVRHFNGERSVNMALLTMQIRQLSRTGNIFYFCNIAKCLPNNLMWKIWEFLSSFGSLSYAHNLIGYIYYSCILLW